MTIICYYIHTTLFYFGGQNDCRYYNYCDFSDCNYYRRYQRFFTAGSWAYRHYCRADNCFFILHDFSFCRNLASLIVANTGLKGAIAPGIASFLGLPSTVIDVEATAESLRACNVPEFMITTLSDYIAKLNLSSVNLSIVVSEALADYIIIFISFIAIFIAVKLLSLLLKLLAKVITKLPVIGFVDRLLGAVIGAAISILTIYGLLYLIGILTFDFMTVIKEEVAKSAIANFLSNYNPFILLLAPIFASMNAPI